MFLGLDIWSHPGWVGVGIFVVTQTCQVVAQLSGVQSCGHSMLMYQWGVRVVSVQLGIDATSEPRGKPSVGLEDSGCWSSEVCRGLSSFSSSRWVAGAGLTVWVCGAPSGWMIPHHPLLEVNRGPYLGWWVQDATWFRAGLWVAWLVGRWTESEESYLQFQGRLYGVQD